MKISARNHFFDFYDPTPSKIAKMWEIIIFDRQPRHLLEVSEINFKLLPNIGLKVAAAFSFRSRTCIMSSAIFVHLSPVYLRLSFLFLAPVYRVLSPDICQDWNLRTINCPQCLSILLCTSWKGYHMMATIKMPQQDSDCYCCNSQGILIFAIHDLFNFVIFFVNILSGKCLST